MAKLKLVWLCLFGLTKSFFPLSAEGVVEWDRTLRVDYQFSGNAREQHISLGELCSFAGWAGRTVNM
ncbi:MAG: peptidase M64, partial [Bacteroidales bacterium]|nr:peptidase M64 [Bacteroidales bacterium]